MSAVHSHRVSGQEAAPSRCSVCHFLRYSAVAGALVFGVVLASGCATTGDTGSGSSLTTLLQQAQEMSANGSREKALALLEHAAKENPTSKEPWLRMAQIHFDVANYPLAMQASQEALVRDPLNQEAKSVLIVSGLRVAARATSELRSENALSGSTRSEAEKLAKSLRETLGESVLVPAPALASGERVAPRETKAKSSAKKVPAKVVARPSSKNAPSGGQPTASAVSGNPFGALR